MIQVDALISQILGLITGLGLIGEMIEQHQHCAKSQQQGTQDQIESKLQIHTRNLPASFSADRLA